MHFSKNPHLLFSFLLVVMNSHAQDYQFENYTVADGLSDNRITCFMKDRTGFIWIGTENGLNRFDGHSFITYNTGTPKRYISNPYVNDIEQDGSGRLWVATQNGLNVIDPVTDSTAVFMSDDKSYQQKETSIPSNLIWDTYIINDRLWIAADMRDLCCYDIIEKKFIYFPWRIFMEQLFPERSKVYTSIRKIYYKSADELWLGTSAGLFSFTISSGKFYHHPGREADHFIQLQQDADRKNVFFIQGPGNELQTLSLNTTEKKNIPFSAIPELTTEDATTAHPSETIWLPAGKDLLEINAVTGRMAKIRHRTDDANSLANGSVRIVYRENTGVVWVGTNNGISKFDPGMRFFKFTPLWPEKTSDIISENDLFRVDHSVHTVFYSEKDDRYYISSPKNNCLVIIEAGSGKKEIIKRINGIPLTACSVIREDRNGTLWILTKTHAFQYHRSEKKFIVANFHPLPVNQLFTDMAEDGDGNLWFTCFNDALYRYRVKDNKVDRMTDPKMFPSNLPTSLYYEEKNNRMWIGTFGHGLYQYDCNKNKFNVLGKSQEIVNSSLVNDIAADKEGNIWVATYAAGIAVYSSAGETKQPRHITTANGLPENNIYSLATDSQGNIWATHFKGLSRIGKEIINYDKKYGLSFSDFFSPLTVSRQGTVFTAINNGFLSFIPDSMYYRSPEFPVVLTSYRTKQREEIKTDKNMGPTVFDHSINEIQFDFAALTYTWPSSTKYEYFLEGVDGGWISSGNLNSAKYNNLQPGNYTFKARAFDFTGQQSSGITSFSFRILPPWWKTWWFLASLLMVIMSLAYYLYQRRIAGIKNKASIRLQIAELKEQALRAQMNPHFIFNSLNAIQELIITESYKDSYLYLSKFSRLLRMVLDLSEKNMVCLGSEIELNRLYIELESLRFKHSFRYNISIDEKIDQDATMFPTMLLQPFIENAIWHGLMQKEGEKELLVDFSEKEHMLVCIVRDNGIGRKKAEEIRSNKIGSGHFASKGISLVRQRMETLTITGMQEATIRITDLCDEEGNATGTQVELLISSPEINHT